MSRIEVLTGGVDQGRRPAQFWVFWSASAVSAIGDGMTIVAVPLLAASITDDPRSISGVRIAALLPWLTLGLAAGVIADRVSRRHLAGYVNGVRFVLLAVVAVLAAHGPATLLPLYVLIFVLGAGQTLFDSAAQALLPDLVPADQLEWANGRLQAGRAIGLTFIGPPLGGLLFAWQPAAPFVVDAVSFAVAAALILTIKPARRAMPVVASVGGTVSRFLGDIWRGLRYVGRSPLLRTFAVLSVAVNFAHGMGNGVMVLFAAEVLGMSTTGFGLLVTFDSIGVLLGSLLASRIAARFGSWWTMRTTIFLAVAGTLLIGLARTPEAVIAIVTVEGLSLGIWGVVSLSVRQRRIPAELLGRAFAVYRTAGLGSMMLGALVSGYVAYLTTLATPYLVGGALGCVVVLAIVARLRDDPTPPSGQPAVDPSERADVS